MRLTEKLDDKGDQAGEGAGNRAAKSHPLVRVTSELSGRRAGAGWRLSGSGGRLRARLSRPDASAADPPRLRRHPGEDGRPLDLFVTRLAARKEQAVSVPAARPGV